MAERGAPVGVFDSGVGGLSALREIRRALPAEDLEYVADSRYAPYGEQPPQLVAERAVAIAEFLIQQGAKAIVVACNTATTVAIDTLRARFQTPIVGVEPGVKPAVATTRTGVVGVLATRATLATAKFSALVSRHQGDARLLLQPCDGLVEQVERGALQDAATRALVERYVRPLIDQGADTLVLGCTHFPFLSAVIQDVAGSGVTLVDPATAVAREVRRRLDGADLLAARHRPGTDRFWTSGSPASVQSVIAQLWTTTTPVRVEAIPPIAGELSNPHIIAT